MTLRTPATLLCFPFAALMLLQGSSCRSSGAQSNSASTPSPVPSNQSKPSPSPVTPSNPRALAEGLWGGQHVSLEVTHSGAEINYDCAHGSITETIVPNGEGKFVVKGVHVRERPGPIREGEDNSQPAKYSGSIEGDTMTLTVTLPGIEEPVGTFTLTRGKAGRVTKCL
jgi:hypothetical protein